MMIFKITTITVLMILICACGQERSSPPLLYQEQLPLPQYPNFDQHPFSLSHPDSVSRFHGSLLFINPNASAPSVANLFSLAKKARESQANLAKFYRKTDYLKKIKDENNDHTSQAGEYTQRINDLQQNKIAFIREANDRNRNNRHLTAQRMKDWIFKEIDRIYQDASSLNSPINTKDQTLKYLELYCDAKVWELATSDFFTQTQFTKRPSPLQICESFYEIKNYFPSHSPLCTDDEQGKSYFSCLWIGALQTYFFQDQYINNDDRNILEELIFHHPEQLHLLLNIQEDGRRGCSRGMIQKSIMMALPQRPNCRRSIKTINRQFMNLFQNASANARNLSPHKIITTFENEVWFPLPPRPGMFSLNTLVRFLGERRLSPSESDIAFSHLGLGETLAEPNHTKLIREKSELLKKEIALISADLLSPSDHHIIDEFSQDIEHLKALRQNARKEKDRLFGDWERASLAAINEAGNSGLTDMLLPMTLTAVNTSQYLGIRIKLGKEEPSVNGCLDLSDRQNSLLANCFPESPSSLPPIMNLSFTPSSGHLHISFTINQEFRKTLRQQANVPGDYFNHLNFAEDFLNHQIIFDIYANRIDDSLDILTGKTIVRHSQKEDRVGYTSFWEESTASQ